jgi:hypothetical protein
MQHIGRVEAFMPNCKMTTNYCNLSSKEKRRGVNEKICIQEGGVCGSVHTAATRNKTGLFDYRKYITNT